MIGFGFEHKNLCLTLSRPVGMECNFRRHPYGNTNANRGTGEVEHVTVSKRKD